MTDSFLQDLAHLGMQLGPLSGAKSVAGLRGMNTDSVQNLRGVDVPNPRHQPLVEQGHLDGTTAGPETLAQRSGRDLQGIGPHLLGAVVRFELSWRDKPYDSQPALIPKQQLLFRTRQFENEAQVSAVRRIGQQNQTRHARLDDDAIGRVQLEDNSLAYPPDGHDPSANDAATKRPEAGSHFDGPQS